MIRRVVVAVAAGLFLIAGCASLLTPRRAISEGRAYLASGEGRQVFPGAVAGEPIEILDADARGLHAYVIPFLSDGQVIGYGDLPSGGEPFAATRLPSPRASLFRFTREEALRWAQESTAKRGPFHQASVEGPFLIYREPRGYSWAVRFAKPPGQHVVYSGATLVVVAKAF